MAARRKKKRKPIKYKTIAFKLSARQKKSLDAYCTVRRTTPIKLIKRSIQHFLTLKPEDPQPDYTTANQLDLFLEEDDLPYPGEEKE